MEKCTHIDILKACLRTRLASACAHFDYRHDRTNILRFLIVILSPLQANVAQYRPLN